MYSANGTTYTEEHSISFGELVTRTSQGASYVDFGTIANTWDDWHLIPSSRPSIAHPKVVTKYIEIPGTDGVLDLTEYLTGAPVYGQREGSLNFIVDNEHENWENLREKIVRILHGQRIKMRLMDDPAFYYDGRFDVGQWQTGSDRSTITISYQLDAYKKKINTEGSTPVLWDPFNFETDYDYYTVMSPLVVSGTTQTIVINTGNYKIEPVVTWVSGNVTLKFGGVTKKLSSAGSVTLGRSTAYGNNNLVVSGTGSVTIGWRGEGL